MGENVVREKSATEKRLDKINVALILLVNMLRNSVKLDGMEVVESIPTETLDRIEKLIS